MLDNHGTIANRMHIREFSSNLRLGREEKRENWAILLFPKTLFPPIADWTENAEIFDYFAILLVGVYQAEFDMI